MEPIDTPPIPRPAVMAALAGAKTAVVAFLTVLGAQLVLALTEIADWVNSSGKDVIEWSGMRKTLLGAAAALILGLVNTAVRFVQAVKVPFFSWLFNKLLGAVPTYPQRGVSQLVVESAKADPAAPVVPIDPAPTDPQEKFPAPNSEVLEVVQETVDHYGYQPVAAAFAAVVPPTKEI